MTPLEKTPLPPGERMGEGVPPAGRSSQPIPLTLTLSPGGRGDNMSKLGEATP